MRMAWRLMFWRSSARDWYRIYGSRIPELQRIVRERP